MKLERGKDMVCGLVNTCCTCLHCHEKFYAAHRTGSSPPMTCAKCKKMFDNDYESNCSKGIKKKNRKGDKK